MKISLFTSSVGNLCFSQSKSKAKIRALLGKKIRFVKLTSWENSTMNGSLCKFYRENSSVENLCFSQSKLKAKIICYLRRKLDLSDLPSTGKNSTITRKL
ncbi:hypothetical protein [Okeania sp. KiyG1]|uniref:hypothetical protein n=1 Tax=Okeania sp. KiyG1 TaxID=2720165 RepID=UPI00192458B0|nr:hypothetical protein [Okeania sp. KiyG1]